MSDAEILAAMEAVNEQLAEMSMNIAVEQIEFFTFGQGRPPVKIHQQPFRWVAGDPRRLAQGDDLTWMINDINGTGPTSLGGVFPIAEFQSALGTWAADNCTQKVNIVERQDTGQDITFFDGFFCGPVFDGFGNFAAADIVEAGWAPASCFGFNTLAFSVTFIFLDAPSGNDINGDNYLDTALNEIWFNDAWGNPATPDGRSGFPWALGGLGLPNIDVETVALHEDGHALGVGHFNGPPAVMNAIYAGSRQSLFPIDHAGMCTVYGGWPK